MSPAAEELEAGELDKLAGQYYNKPFSALTGDDAKTVQAIRNFHRNAAETVPASAPSATSPAAGAAKTPRPVPTTNLRVRDRETVMQEVNDKLNLKADMPEGTGEVYKSQGGEAASSHIQAMQAKDAAIAKYLRENPKALGGKKWSELTDANRQSILQDINKAIGKKYTYSPNTAARAGEIDRLLQ